MVSENVVYIWARGEKLPPATDHAWSRQSEPWLPTTAWARAIQLQALCWWERYERKGWVCVCVCARAHMHRISCQSLCQRQQSGSAHFTSMCGEEGEGEETPMSWCTSSAWEKDPDRRRHKRKGDQSRKRKTGSTKPPEGALYCTERPKANLQEIRWRRKWQPLPVFLPGESHELRSQVGYRPWCRKLLSD